MNLHPTAAGGNCLICKRRHHPGRGCPRWRKWSEAKRIAFLAAVKKEKP